MRQTIWLVLLLFLFGCGAQTVTQVSSNDLKAGAFSGAAIGAFVNGMTNITSFQSSIGRNLAVVLWYVQWPDPFPTDDANTVNANGSVPLITWEPQIANALGTLEAIAAGSYESYVTSFLQAAKAWNKPLFLRFAHEMNGNWYAWDGSHNGESGGADRYIKAWRYIYNVKNSLKADNVIMVWCPNNKNQPAVSWNAMTAYYPGDAYVDWVGMDGYNWGSGSWEAFDQVFSGAYATITALTDKPLMIGEFACAEQGGAKAAWISDAFNKIQTNYSRVKIFCWFNINKERDWRVSSTASAEAAVKNALQNSYFLDR
ncbi:MAG: glycosyl hydrolase, partial [Candidatus Margulisbacteria bacterium]|nr:glycosyl hydrolase [Candidatus Margulisiibacteriota bacterium]